MSSTRIGHPALVVNGRLGPGQSIGTWPAVIICDSVGAGGFPGDPILAEGEVVGVSALEAMAAGLCERVLAPPGSNLVLAEWTAEPSEGDEIAY